MFLFLEDAELEQYREFSDKIDWIQFPWNRIGLGIFDGIRGIGAREDIQPGHALTFLPEFLAVTASKALNMIIDIASRIDTSVDSSELLQDLQRIPVTSRMAVVLNFIKVHHKHPDFLDFDFNPSNKSFTSDLISSLQKTELVWQSYVNLLPPADNFPLSLNLTLAEELYEGTDLASFLVQRISAAESNYDKFCVEMLCAKYPTLFPQAEITLDAFKWGLSMLWSRSFTLGASGGALMPIADMFNMYLESGYLGRESFVESDGTLILLTDEFIPKGSQVFLRYSNEQLFSNGQILLDYGFLPMENPRNFFPIKFCFLDATRKSRSNPKLQKLERRKFQLALRLLKRYQPFSNDPILGTGGPDCVRIDLKTGSINFELLFWARMKSLNGVSFKYQKPKLLKEWDRVSQTQAFLQERISPSNEIRAISKILKLLIDQRDKIVDTLPLVIPNGSDYHEMTAYRYKNQIIQFLDSQIDLYFDLVEKFYIGDPISRTGSPIYDLLNIASQFEQNEAELRKRRLIRNVKTFT